MIEYVLPDGCQEKLNLGSDKAPVFDLVKKCKDVGIKWSEDDYCPELHNCPECKQKAMFEHVRYHWLSGWRKLWARLTGKETSWGEAIYLCMICCNEEPVIITWVEDDND